MVVEMASKAALLEQLELELLVLLSLDVGCRFHALIQL